MNKLDHYMALPYTPYTAYEKDCDGQKIWSAWVEELPGCETHAATKEEALIDLEDAKRVYMEGLLERGVSPPLPSSTAWEVTVPETPGTVHVGHAMESTNVCFSYPHAGPALERVIPRTT